MSSPALHVLVIGSCLAGAANLSRGETIDKRGFTLVNPTPRDRMREMTTDRPDATESPFTVDAGHIQFETSLIDWTYDTRNAGDTSGSTLTWAQTNIRLGLTNQTEIALVFTPYSRERAKDQAAGTVDYPDGAGDLEFRFKWNLLGNDDGKIAFGLLPHLILPTGSDDLSGDHVQGGIILPLAVELCEGLGLGTMLEIDFVYDDVDRGYDTELLHTLSVGADLVGDLGGYIEYASIWSGDSGTQYQGILGGGLTYAVTEDLQLDLGVNFGLTKSADDLNLFLGFSWRY